MPILKPRINSSLEDKRLGSIDDSPADKRAVLAGNSDLDPSLLSLKSVHDDKHRWDYLKDHIGKPSPCINSWALCNCDTAIFIRGVEMGLSQKRIRELEEII